MINPLKNNSNKSILNKITRTPQLAVIFLILSLGFVRAGELMSQSTNLSVSINNKSVRDVFDLIENSSEYTFFYYDHVIDLNRKVSINKKDQSIEKILDSLFEGTDNSYYIKNNQVYITLNERPLVVKQQSRTILGKVLDREGEPLIGASIVIRDSGKGTITNIDGEFKLDVPENAVLDVSYVGYVKQSIRITNQEQLTIVLLTDELGLDEVVVIGYGFSKKSDLTGSVASVKAEDLEKFPAANVTEMLRGQAPGVQVSLNNTEPGGASSILIRGKRSLSSKQSPLYLVDGMIVPHIDDLNSNDIASIEILKDASSQAIYGSRASNGVIMITTKRGETGKTRVDLSSYVGFQTYRRNFDMYSPEEYLQLRYWAKYNEGMGEAVGPFENMNVEAVLDDAIMYDSWLNKKFTDWEDLMLSNALQHKHDISIRGGSNQLKYSVGLGYFEQDGMVLNSGYKRASFRTNLDYSPFKWLDMGSNISYTRDEKQSAQSAFNEIITMSALSQAFDDDGELLRDVNNQGDISPLWRNREYDKQVQNEYLLLSAYANFKLFRGFSYRVDASIRSGNRETGEYKTKLFPASTGEGSISTYNRQSYLVNNVVNYELPISNPDHKLSVTLIQSVDQDLQKTTGYSFINSTTDRFNWNIAQDSEIDGVTRTVRRERSVSFAGRMQYNFKDRYLLTASLRRDGASVFGAGNKWANFPSVALAWRVNEENFMESYNWLDMLKLRISYGVVGNWAIESYRTLGLANKQEYLLNDKLVIGYLPTTELLNKNLRWETTNSTNLGIDFSIFNGKLSGLVEHYQTYTNDLLIKRSVPTITGYSTMWDNLGKTKSWGWEFALQSKVINTRDLQWNLGATFSTQRNKIVRIDGRVDEYGNPVNDLSNNWFIGESMNVAYNYVFGGIWQEGAIPTENDYLPGDATPVPGDIKLLDYNGDGQITTDDRKIYNLDPDWYATFNTSLYYKGLDLSLEFYTVQNVTKSNPYLYAYNQGGSLNGKKNGIKVNYWTPENPSNEAPRPQFTASVPYFGVLAYQNASYFRLRTATIGYTFPRKWTSIVHIDKLRFYFTGTNLFTVTDYKSYSPEKEPSGYPEPQTFTFGVNVSF